MKTKKSVVVLRKFLQKNYIDNEAMGSPSMSTAIRDCLTDLLHLCDEEGIVLDRGLEGAKIVYEDELTEEVREKTGVSP